MTLRPSRHPARGEPLHDCHGQVKGGLGLFLRHVQRRFRAEVDVPVVLAPPQCGEHFDESVYWLLQIIRVREGHLP
jgi:hypothetical protein